jgi:translation initiation factor 2B subunit (eIF-2B alpha/beta/delta family)
VDPTFRRQLAAIQRDRHSGASELALRACAAFQGWLHRRPKPTIQELLDAVHSILHAQPFMAPLIRLANDLLLAAESDRSSRALADTARDFNHVLKRAAVRISREFIRSLRRHSPCAVVTYSYSSTVIQCLSRSRARLLGVLCSESRPGFEGRAMAEALARNRIPVLFFTEAGLSTRIGEARAFVTGADAVLSGGFINKAGTRMFASRALESGREVWVLADTTKFIPEMIASGLVRPWLRAGQPGPRAEVWARPPAGVFPLNPYFERAPFSPGIRVLTERGWMTPEAVGKALEKISVSARLLAMAD